jgi:hypothetical protein
MRAGGAHFDFITEKTFLEGESSVEKALEGTGLILAFISPVTPIFLGGISF